MAILDQIWDSKNGTDLTDAKDDKNWLNITIRSAAFKWTLSTGGGTNEYFLELFAGGDPGLDEPGNVYEALVALLKGTVGSLAISGWGFGDVDTLGFNTIYVRTSGEVDPDTLILNAITFTIVPTGSDNVFVPFGSGPMTTNVDFSDRTLGEWIVEDGATALFGGSGSPVKITVSKFDFAGSGRAFFDLLASAISPVIRRTAQAATNEFAFRLNGSALNFVDIRAGSVDFDPDAVFTRTESSLAARVRVPSGVTLTTYDNRGSTQLEANTTNLNNNGGTTTTDGSAIVANITCKDGIVISNASGLVTEVVADESGSIDFLQSQTPRNVTNITRRGNGEVKFDSAVVTHTGSITGTVLLTSPG